MRVLFEKRAGDRRNFENDLRHVCMRYSGQLDIYLISHFSCHAASHQRCRRPKQSTMHFAVTGSDLPRADAPTREND